MDHIPELDLEHYHLGMVQNDAELAIIEEHLLICSQCIDQAEESAHYVDWIRAAIIEGNLDLE